MITKKFNRREFEQRLMNIHKTQQAVAADLRPALEENATAANKLSNKVFWAIFSPLAFFSITILSLSGQNMFYCILATVLSCAIANFAAGRMKRQVLRRVADVRAAHDAAVKAATDAGHQLDDWWDVCAATIGYKD